MTYTEAEILAIGGTLWTRRAHRRVYLNNWHAWIELDITSNEHGAITGATLAGQPIMPHRAGQLRAADVYWEADALHYEDVASYSKQFFGDDRLVQAVLAGIAEAVKRSKKSTRGKTR